ncbi:MAG: SH3 domain-containing protein [Anaerolineae bacterium]
MMAGRKLTLVAVVLAMVALFALGVSLSAAPANDFGTNWTAQYYNNATLSGSPIYTETLPNGINFNWGTGSPNPAVPVDNFSARFTSTQNFTVPGTYQFVATSDDGIRVYINNQLIIDKFVGRVLTTDTVQMSLPAGPVSMVVEYMELIDQAAIQFQWFLVGGGVMPTATPYIFVTAGPTSTATAIPPTPLPPIPPGALTGTVIKASVLLARSGPFLGAPVVSRVLRGQTYQILGRDEAAQWFLLQLSGQQGWVWGYYLFVNGNSFTAPVANPFQTAGQPASNTGVAAQSTATLRLRAAPNTASEQIGRIPWGYIMPVLGRTADGGWLQVLYYSTVGYVAVPYVKIVEGDVNSLPVVQ